MIYIWIKKAPVRLFKKKYIAVACLAYKKHVHFGIYIVVLQRWGPVGYLMNIPKEFTGS